MSDWNYNRDWIDRWITREDDIKDPSPNRLVKIVIDFKKQSVTFYRSYSVSTFSGKGFNKLVIAVFKFYRLIGENPKPVNDTGLEVTIRD